MPENPPHGGVVRRLGRSWLVLAAALSGCAVPPPTREPMDVHAFLAPSGSGERAVVFLPGRRDRPLDFVENGFLERLRAVQPDVDVYIPDAHLGFYLQCSVVTRLHEDVLAPLRARGYRQITLVGVSMGGLGALLYTYRHPQNVDGIALIAPYLGERDLVRSVGEAGGPGAWNGPRPTPGAMIGGVRELWGWFGQWPERRPDVPIHIAYGTDDRFAQANAMLAGLLPPENVLTTDGGHRWVVWSELWRQILAQGRIPADGPTQQATAIQ